MFCFGVMLGVYTMLFFGLLFVVCRPEYKKYYVLVKGVNSFAFVAVFFVSGYRSGEIWQFFLMLPAFLCCFAGDILMGCYHRYRIKKLFLTGLLIFLIGHICFVRWMCRIQQMDIVELCFPLLALLFVFWLTSERGMHTGKLRPFILIYTFFVALLFAKGVHLAVADASVRNLVTAAGSTLFMVSDISILFLYFTERKGPGIHIFNLSTYYYGVFLLASSLLFLP